eukprot:m.226119 g.226119  ORF g.226119 m.226119 type:complete len:801 (+) comp17045_c2_seq7:161-2563(+)
MSQSENKDTTVDRRIEAAAIHTLQEARVGIVFTIPKDKKRKEDLVQGRYFTWLASQPPTFHMTRPLADIVDDKELTASFELCGRKISIPRIVYDICTYLRKTRQLGTEGLFRKSGNAARVRMLQQHFDAYGKLPLKDLNDNKYSSHDMVQVLKAFLRHLPGGIIHFLYKSYIVAQRCKYEQDAVTRRSAEEGKTHGLRMTLCLCYLLPQPNRDLLHFLMHFFVSEFGPAQEQCQAHNTMTLDNIAKVLAPTLLPTSEENMRQGGEDEADLIIDAVRDMMVGYKNGWLFSNYPKSIRDKASKIAPDDAQKIYKSGYLDKLNKPKRRSRASGISDAIKSAGGEVIKQLQRRGSSRSNVSERSTNSRSGSTHATPKSRRHRRISLSDLPSSEDSIQPTSSMISVSSTTSAPHLTYATTKSSSSANHPASLHVPTEPDDTSGISGRPRSFKRRSEAAHEVEHSEDHVRQRFKFGDDPFSSQLSQPASTRIISAAEAKRKGYAMTQLLDPRQQTVTTTEIDEASRIEHASKQFAASRTPRHRRRSFEAARRLSDGLSGSAKKMKNFMQRRRSGRTMDQSDKDKGQSVDSVTKEDSELSREQFLDLIPQATYNDSDSIPLEELHLFSQMCYEAQATGSVPQRDQRPCIHVDDEDVNACKKSKKSPIRDPRFAASTGVTDKASPTSNAARRILRKTRVGQPLVLQQPAQTFNQPMPQQHQAQRQPTYQQTSEDYATGTRKATQLQPPSASLTSSHRSSMEQPRSKSTKSMDATPKHRAALTSIHNMSPQVSNLRTPLLQLEDRYTFV